MLPLSFTTTVITSSSSVCHRNVQTNAASAFMDMTATSLSVSHCHGGSSHIRLSGCGWTYNNRKRSMYTSYSPPLASLSGRRTPASKDPVHSNLYLEVLEDAREKFTHEISRCSNDKGYLSLAKALLYVAAEDEAFMAINREMDSNSIRSERREDGSTFFRPKDDWSDLETMPLAGKSMSEWLAELDNIAKEVEAELIPRDIGCDLMEVMEAVNFVLLEYRGFRRFPTLVDSKFSYLHTVLSSGRSSAILLSVIYIEVCRRIGVTVIGSRVGEEFLIWPQTENPEELFKVTSGNSLFSLVNGRCVEDPSSKASDLKSKSLLGLDIATDKDIVGIALANLIRLHWKRASRMNHGLMLTSPLRRIGEANEIFKMFDDSKHPLLRPLELRLAIMASERLLLLQPHNWALRRDHGMLLFYSRKYAEAVQELSICMAFAPVEEVEVLEPFVEKLHLLRIESSWKSLEHNGGRLTVP
ncbi:uncharacterized protein LOC113309985 isoform X1 [Papaver somniferum]|nr:uncharacterized protein LOC113309985 isoform X1 [Papaver somniferum]